MADDYWTNTPTARAWRCPVPSAAPVEFHTRLPGYAVTPLVELPSLADELGVGRLLLKDESMRLGLPAFKVLGVSWAVHRIFLETGVTTHLVAASDGNHGRALAHVAGWHGIRARVYLPDGVHHAAREAILAEGATVFEVSGSYDDAVDAALADAQNGGATLVQDTAWPGYEQIPSWIVEGYSTMFWEIDDQLGTVPDLVIVPVGVGSLAQAAVMHYRRRGLERVPALLSVEPLGSACLLQNLRNRRLRPILTTDTIMTGLNCGTVSYIAWPNLLAGIDAACSVSDRAAARAVDDLVHLGVLAGPCGAATLAAARYVLADLIRARGLGVANNSVVVLLCTEGLAANPYRRPC